MIQPKKTPRPPTPPIPPASTRTIRLRRPGRIRIILIRTRHMFAKIPRIIMARQHPIPRILRHAIPAIARALPEIGMEAIRNDSLHEPVHVQQLVQDRAGLVGDVWRRGARAGAGE